MDEEEKKVLEGQTSDVASQPSAAPTEAAPVEDARPNRTAFAGRFSKRHKDIDFEDKEARYGALNEDADRLEGYEESGRTLSGVFEQHRWMASMFEALRKDKDLDPISWMADNGIDIGSALDDEEYRKQISERVAAFQKREIEGAKAEKKREKALAKSWDDLASLGLPDEENLRMWKHFFEEVLDPALRGEIGRDTWELVRKALNYDNDISNAAEQAGMQARNEKIRNRVKNSNTEVPPTLPQGGGSRTETPKKQQGFFEDLMG